MTCEISCGLTRVVLVQQQQQQQQQQKQQKYQQQQQVVKEPVRKIKRSCEYNRRNAPEMTYTRRDFSQSHRYHHHQHQHQHHHHRRYKFLYLLTFIGLIFCNIHRATGGICWSSISNGKCKELLSQGVTRQECCASSTGAATAYSDEDLDSGSLFFWRVLGGGVQCKPCRESCAEVKCEEGKKCVLRRGRPRCVCSPECKSARGSSNGPVCGTDGRSYRSLCRLKKHACKKASHELAVAYNGYCQSSCTRVHCDQGRSCLLDQNLSPHCVRCARKCPQAPQQVASARPVCGADGNTYKSACHLRLAACRAGRAIPVAYKGHCKQNADCTTIRCREGQTCLTDMKSNRPRCVTCTYRCPRKHEKMNTRRDSYHRRDHVDRKGNADESQDPAAYPSVLCATNNITYPSWCHIIKDACVTGFVLETKHAGPCNSYDIPVYPVEKNITTTNYQAVDVISEESKNNSESLSSNKLKKQPSRE